MPYNAHQLQQNNNKFAAHVIVVLKWASAWHSSAVRCVIGSYTCTSRVRHTCGGVASDRFERVATMRVNCQRLIRDVVAQVGTSTIGRQCRCLGVHRQLPDRRCQTTDHTRTLYVHVCRRLYNKVARTVHSMYFSCI